MFWDGSRWVEGRPLGGQVAPAPTPRRRRGALLTIGILVLVPALLIPFLGVEAARPRLTVTGTVEPGVSINLAGDGFQARIWLQLQWDGSAAGMSTVRTSNQGTFGTSLTIPATTIPGPHVVGATLSSSGSRSMTPAATTAVLAFVTVTVFDPSAIPTPVATVTAPTPPAASFLPSPTPATTPTSSAAAVLASSTPATIATPMPVPTAPVRPSPIAHPTSTPVPTVGPITGPKVVEIESSVTAAEFVSAAQDNTTDIIELAGGTYRPGIIRLNVDRTRPLLIRPASGATVVFAGGSRPAFYIGLGGAAGRITIEGLIFDGFNMGPDGIIWLGDCHDITVNNMVVRHSTGEAGYSWALYVSTDGGIGPHNVVANNWIVDGGARTLGGLAIGHTPPAQGVTATGWRVTNASYAIYSNTPATGVNISNWTIESSGLTTFAYLSVVLAQTQGTIRNVDAINSGAPEIVAPMVDGGGNSWK